ncbi:MAG: tRNA (adenosine(37)-N6)-threonylcarbamoyltransferase complex ATPase subunit type 1 TsaE [Phycisphaerae bacterium]
MSAIVQHTTSEEQTRALAERLGRLLRRGDFVALCGPMGAGKTAFAKGVAIGLGVAADEPVISPTFVLMREYTGRETLYHGDAYRLGSIDELLDLGFDEMRESGVVLLEWADKFAELLTGTAVRVELEYADDGGRRITIEKLDEDRAATLQPAT